MTGILLVGVVGLILMRGVMTRTDVYEAFLHGARRGMKSALDMLPALCAMLLMLGLLHSSGVTEMLTKVLAPLMKCVGIPEEITPLLLLRPLTGAGSIAAMEEIFASCGVSSRAGRMAAALMGASETTFYTVAVYGCAAGEKRIHGVIPASLCGYAASVLVCMLLIR